MFCKQCGKEMNEGTKFCPHCGGGQEAEVKNSPEIRKIPKCTCCGYVGEWKVGPVFRPVDFIIGILFLFLGVVPGLIYLGVVGIIRSNKDNREKICPKCKAKNLWTFTY